MLEHTTVKSEEEIELDNNNGKNDEIKEEIKEEEKNKKEEIKNENNNINDNKNNNNKKIGLGFFGRLVAPIFLTESEINNING